jgi:hypothetical protein
VSGRKAWWRKGAENASCLLKRCIPLGRSRCQPRTSDLLRRVLGTLKGAENALCLGRLHLRYSWMSLWHRRDAPSDLLRCVLGTLRANAAAPSRQCHVFSTALSPVGAALELGDESA